MKNNSSIKKCNAQKYKVKNQALSKSKKLVGYKITKD